MPIGLLNNQFIQDLRTTLLNRNLNPTTEANLGGLSSLNLDRGTPTDTSLPQGEYIPFNQSTVSSLGYYQLKNMSLKNRYAPSEFTEVEITDISSIAGNIGTYTNYARTQTANDFDLKQFVLNSPSILGYSDTPLGVIGAEQLKFSLEANIAQNTIKNTAGRVNLNLFSLLNGEEFLIRNYQISEVPNTPLGFFVNLAQKYSGFEIPKSFLPADAFGFFDSLFDGKVIYGDCNLEDLSFKDQSRMKGIDRNNSLLRFTGRGQRVQLFNMLGINKYRPNYDDPNGPDTGLNRIFGFLQQRKNNNEASYNTLNDTRRSSGVLPIMQSQGIADPFQKTGDESLRGVVGSFKENDSRSVLGNNGLPKITWTNKDVAGGFKRFMFSIENLAWIGYTDGLPECEIGNGDLSSNDKRPGRIMWFPPYDLSFDESVSVDWAKTSFIGRGEQIFTYNNTSRSGTIKFKIVVDHPSIINELKKNSTYSESDMLKFFKGCKSGKDYVQSALGYLTYSRGTVSQETIDRVTNKIVEVGNTNYEKRFNTVTSPGGTKNFTIKIYFENNQTSVNTTYENPGSFGLNSTGNGFLSPESLSNIGSLNVNEVKSIDVTISTTASSRGSEQNNNLLLEGRFNEASSWIKSQISNIELNITRGSNVIVPNTTTNDPNSITEKEARVAKLDFVVNLKDLTTTGQTTVAVETFADYYVQDKIQELVSKVVLPVYRECDYFEFLETNETFIFSQLKEKLKYFHPGFHSTTPEGFNSRLTFLHQCTRQGPAIDENAIKSNLAFGRPPICILRIGDYFHTKMVIDSMSIQYDDNLWDLNPEGIGVQPRLATVSLTVSYIGGQSLMTPIKELQNAIAFNFYANTETFQHAPIILEDREVIGVDRDITKVIASGKKPKETIIEEPNVPDTLIPFVDSPIGSNREFYNQYTTDYNNA
jgi:hypothetical protein